MEFNSLKIEKEYDYRAHKEQLKGRIDLRTKEGHWVNLNLPHETLLEMLKLITPLFENAVNEQLEVLKKEWLSE